jgi:hypothetical protein
MNSTTYELVLTAPVKQATLAVREEMTTNDGLVVEALIAIYNRQTADEKQSAVTTHENGYGFSGFDAEFGSSLATQAIKRGTLSEKQMIYARKLIRKYAGQLVRIMREEATPVA